MTLYRRYDLGAGQNPKEGFFGVDIVDCGNGNVVHDLTDGSKPWPWEDSSVDELYSAHFIEHIPNDNTFVPYAGAWQDRLFWFFDEAYRVIKPGGIFELSWPSLKSTDAFRDPTHRRFIPLEMTHYLSREGRAAMRVDHYFVRCDWRIDEGEARVSVEPNLPADMTAPSRLWDVEKQWMVRLRAEK